LKFEILLNQRFPRILMNSVWTIFRFYVRIFFLLYSSQCVFRACYNIHCAVDIKLKPNLVTHNNILITRLHDKKDFDWIIYIRTLLENTQLYKLNAVLLHILEICYLKASTNVKHFTVCELLKKIPYVFSKKKKNV